MESFERDTAKPSVSGQMCRWRLVREQLSGSRAVEPSFKDTQVGRVLDIKDVTGGPYTKTDMTHSHWWRRLHPLKTFACQSIGATLSFHRIGNARRNLVVGNVLILICSVACRKLAKRACFRMDRFFGGELAYVTAL